MSLWQESEGVGLSASDQPDQIGRFLDRNPGFSFVALANGSVVGALLCGHDGRRGYIHHLAVRPEYQRLGFGRQLVDRSLRRLSQAGILKCHLFIFSDNVTASAFWDRLGWTRRSELAIMSKVIDHHEVAP